jgi:hypothetical protein
VSVFDEPEGARFDFERRSVRNRLGFGASPLARAPSLDR